ncbi:hypothetical protein B5V48_26350 [Salmonella enterica]|nr:hypothetical protein [Salmonella enterica]
MFKKNTNLSFGHCTCNTACCVQLIHRLFLPELWTGHRAITSVLHSFADEPLILINQPPAASVPRPAGHGTGGFSAQARVVVILRHALAMMRNALQAAFANERDILFGLYAG